jgi:hypothetical protein
MNSGTAMCFWSSLSQRFAAVCWLLACLCSVTWQSPSYRETDLGNETGGVSPSAIFSRFSTLMFSLLLASSRLSAWRHQIGLGCEGGCWKTRWYSNQNTSSAEEFISRKLWWACRRWWVPHWSSISCTLFFCNRSLCVMFTIFIWMILCTRLLYGTKHLLTYSRPNVICFI